MLNQRPKSQYSAVALLQPPLPHLQPLHIPSEPTEHLDGFVQLQLLVVPPLEGRSLHEDGRDGREL